MRSPDELPHIAELIQDHRESFEILSKSNLSIAEYTLRALEWLDENASEGDVKE
jgi:hypothetical protein